VCLIVSVAYRIETGRLDKAERTPQGGLRMQAAVGRVGILEYRKADGSPWREYRSPAEAFKAESLSSLRGAPVTNLHPAGPVTSSTFRAVSMGHVGDDTRRDEDGRHILASVIAQDERLVSAIEAGDRSEVSAGYTTDVVERAGVTPDGEHYDAEQTNITYNHVAIGPRGWGRAGPTVALRLDSNLDVITEPPASAVGKERTAMKTQRIDGVDYEVGTEAWSQALAKHDADTAAKLANLTADLATQTARADKAEGERDELKGRTDALEAAATSAADPVVIGALVAARVALETKATGINSTLKCDGMTDRELMVAALGIETTDETADAYIVGRFDAAVEQSEKAGASRSTTRIVADHAGNTGGMSIAEAARQRHVIRNRDGWKVRN